MTTRRRASPSADTAGWRAHPAAPDRSSTAGPHAITPTTRRFTRPIESLLAEERPSNRQDAKAAKKRIQIPLALLAAWRLTPWIVISVSAAGGRALQRPAGVGADVLDLGLLGFVEGHQFVVLGAIGLGDG